MLRYLLGFIFCIGASFSLFAQTSPYQLDVNDQPLEEVILELEKKYQLLFSYNEKAIEAVRITAQLESEDLSPFLQALFKTSPLQFEIVNKNYIILTERKTSDQSLSNAVEEKEPLFSLCGIIIDSFTQSPLLSANVYVERSQLGSYTKADGRFQIRSTLEPGDVLVISYVGYQEKRLPAKAFLDTNCPQILLNYYDFGEDFIIVTDYLTDGVDLGDNGASTLLRPGRIEAFPGQAEPDVLTTIQFLPGISSPDGEASNIYIRGGTPDQNLILWEDIPIYHSAHYFGMISAFNPYITDKIEVYRGGFGADYGSRVSGVIDMKSPDTSLPESDFGAGINFINAYTYGKFALLDNKLALTYSLRRSTREMWRSPTFKNITKRNEQGLILGDISLSQLPDHIEVDDEFNFFDTHLKAAVRLSDQDEVTAAWFYGTNEFEDIITDKRERLDQKDTLNLDNWGASLSWKRQWTPRWESKLVGLRTRYSYNYRYNMQEFMASTPERVGSKENLVEEQQVHLSNQYKTEAGIAFKLGYHYTHYDFSYRLADQFREQQPTDEQRAYSSDLHAGYVELSTAKEKRFGGDIGLRYSYFERIQQHYLAPRLRLWYEVNDDLRLHFSAGKYHQFLGQLIEFKGNQGGINTPIWVLAADVQVPVQIAYQYQIGLVYNKKSWVVDLQAYYKEIDGLTSRATDFDELMEGAFVLGMTKIKGVDILVKNAGGIYIPGVSYSLSDANYLFERFFDPEFSAPYNQRHAFNWVNMWTYKDFEFSLGWTLQSGKPYSVMDRIEVVEDNMGRRTARAIYDSYNNQNLPLQQLLNASARYNIRPKDGSKWKAVIGLSLYNIFQHTNTFSRDFFIAGRRNQPYRIESYDKVGLGFTPNAVFRIEF